MSTADKFERQMNLLAALCDTSRPLRFAEIRETVRGYGGTDAGARQTFERDKRALRELGVPIETIEGGTAEETGYRVDRERYELPQIDLDPEELAALHLALQTLQVGVTDGDIARALWRFGGTLDAPADGDAVVRLVDEVHEIPTAPALLPLFRAITDRCTVALDYEAASNSVARRKVEPWRLSFERGRWYVRAFDVEREAPRNFRLDRIRGEVELGRPGSATAAPEESPEGPSDPWEYGEGEPTAAELRLDPVAAPIGAAALRGCPSREEPDGSVVWTVPVANWPAFRSFVLSFRERAEILAPAELRAAMAEWLESICDPASARGGVDG